MDAVFQLKTPPEAGDIDRVEQSLRAQRGVTWASVDPRQGRVFVSFEPMLTGEMALQEEIERQGLRVAQSDETVDYLTDTPGYTREAADRVTEQHGALNTTDAVRISLPQSEMD